MQEKVKTIPSETKTKTKSVQKKGNRKKNKRTPTNKVKADNMRLRVHYCKINSMSMNNNKMIYVVVWQTILKMFCVLYASVCVCVCVCFWVSMCVCAACFRAWTWMLAQTHPCSGNQPRLTSLITHLSINVQYCSSLIKKLIVHRWGDEQAHVELV